MKSLSMYAYPGEGNKADETDSLIVHSNDYFRPSASLTPPPKNLINKALNYLERSYGPVVWILPDNFDSKENFERLLYNLEMSSSPGYPYMKEYPTIGEWLKFNGVTFCPTQVERLWVDVLNVMSGDWQHVLRVFIKQEPHKLNKVEEGRWRLIMASSLAVQMVWHMLFSYQNDKEIEQCYRIPSQHGIVLVKGGWKEFQRQWDRKGLNSGLDKRAWDWTAPIWLIEAELELRFRLARGDRLQEWYDLAKNMYHHMFRDVFLLMSDGTLFRQIVPGVVKSGCVNTISLNGHAQSILHVVVCMMDGLDVEPVPSSCGDDTLQHERHVQDLETYRSLGIQIKSVSDTREFVGHEFRSSGPHPAYILKHLYRLNYVKDDDLSTYLDSMARMYVHTEHFDFWSRLAIRLGKVLPLSKNAYMHWYDVPEDE